MFKKNKLMGNFKNGLSYYIYNNEFEDNISLYLTIKLGSINERKNENGIAHLLEHMCLSYNRYESEDEFFKNKLIKIDPNKFNYKGYTDFDRTILCITTKSNDYKNLSNGIHILNKILNGDMLNKNLLESIKKDVIDECNYYKNKATIQQKILSFITNNQINTLPMGNIESIANFTFEDLLEFHKENYIASKMAVIIIGNIDVIKTKKLITKNLCNKVPVLNRSKEKSFSFGNNRINKILIMNKNIAKYTEVKFFYNNQYNNLSIKDKLIRYLFESMFKNYIKHKFKLYKLNMKEVLCENKIISKHYKFFIVLYKITEIKNSINIYMYAIKELKKGGFNKGYYDLEINKFKHVINDLYNQDFTINNDDIYEECLYNFLYDESIFFIKEDYNLILNNISQITIEDINAYMISIFSNTYHVIIEPNR